jgi:hypothetical protein
MLMQIAIIMILGRTYSFQATIEQVEQNRINYDSKFKMIFGPSSLYKLFWECIKSPITFLLQSVAGFLWHLDKHSKRQL